jgi:hypothetical protein
MQHAYAPVNRTSLFQARFRFDAFLLIVVLTWPALASDLCQGRE